MKILLVNRDKNSTNGQEIIFQYIAKGLYKDNDVELLTTESNDEFTILSKSGIKTYEVSYFNFFDDKIIKLYELQRIRKSIRGKSVVLINNPLTILGAITLIFSFNKTTVCSFHGKMFANNKVKNFFNTIRKLFFINLASLSSDKFIFLTDEDKAYFSKYIILKKWIKKEIINNGVDIDFFKPAQEVEKNKFNILFIGRLTESKGVKDILEAANELRDLPVNFQFAGSIGDEDIAESISEKTNCEYLGLLNREKIRSALQNCDVFILPSYSECFPVTLLEALSMARPVITTNIFGITSILHNTENILVEPGQPEQIVKAVKSYFKDKKLMQRVGEQNRQLVVEKYSISTMTSNYIKALSNG